MRRLLILSVLCMVMAGNCTDAEVASSNLTKAAEQFELDRRVVFLNGITDKYILVVEGKCSIDHQREQLEVTCKVGKDEFVKHHLGLSDNVSYFSEQLRAAKIDSYHYRVIFKPSVIVPKIDLK